MYVYIHIKCICICICIYSMSHLIYKWSMFVSFSDEWVWVFSFDMRCFCQIKYAQIGLLLINPSLEECCFQGRSKYLREHRSGNQSCWAKSRWFMVSPTFTLEMNWLILVRRHLDRWTHQHVGVSVAMGYIMIYIMIYIYIYYLYIYIIYILYIYILYIIYIYYIYIIHIYIYYIYIYIPICSHFLGKLMITPMEVWSILSDRPRHLVPTPSAKRHSHSPSHGSAGPPKPDQTPVRCGEKQKRTVTRRTNFRGPQGCTSATHMRTMVLEYLLTFARTKSPKCR